MIEDFIGFTINKKYNFLKKYRHVYVLQISRFEIKFSSYRNNIKLSAKHAPLFLHDI
jgi:hypothetical protein